MCIQDEPSEREVESLCLERCASAQMACFVICSKPIQMLIEATSVKMEKYTMAHFNQALEKTILKNVVFVFVF